MTDASTISIPGEPGAPEDAHYVEERSRVYKVLVNAEFVLAALLLVMLFAVVITQVVARYVFSAPISGSEELSRFTFIWFTFIAASFVGARRKHIIVQLFTGGKTGKLAAAAEVFAYLVMIAVSAVLIFGGVLMVTTMWDIASPGLEMPYRFVYSALPVGFVLIAVHAVVNLVLALMHPEQFAGQQDVETAGL
ncbi:TRAP transporter small permease [Nesterenkonia alba]|uniref:TRAP transporter small permease n=1 Tax=Nesterenkonia alba TaxID=515814 RepID=UPI0003B6F2F0|nr:TRAP transporter small permease [Nesterenkonia alba]